MSTASAFMLRALELAALARGRTGSNPMVGAVLVHGGRILSEGWHRQYGGPHAEADCLNRLRAADRYLLPEATMYVTLEPCAHQGKTPPCALRLVREGVGKVVVASDDPFEKVDGRGMRILEEAGIATETGLLNKEARWLNRRFFTFHEKGRPYIILKWAQSADGYLAPQSRERTAFSGPLSQQLLHRWRSEESAILVGYNTALHDDPQLTARLHDGPQPLRIALDRALRLPRGHHLFDGTASTWIVNAQREEDLAERQLRLVRVSFGETLLPAVLNELHAASRLSLIVEGGAQLLRSFIEADLWDEARIFKTPAALQGGIPAPLLTGAMPFFQTALGPDELHCSLNAGSGFSPPPGAAL